MSKSIGLPGIEIPEKSSSKFAIKASSEPIMEISWFKESNTLASLAPNWPHPIIKIFK